MYICHHMGLLLYDGRRGEKKKSNNLQLIRAWMGTNHNGRCYGCINFNATGLRNPFVIKISVRYYY
jgi:hypothetical protein